MTFDVQILGPEIDYVFFTNGAQSKVDSNHWVIEYPSYFTCSSPFFEAGPATEFIVGQWDYASVNGTKLQVTYFDWGPTNPIFTENPRVPDQYAARIEAMNKTRPAVQSYFEFLEKNYGSFPHPNLLLRASGNMEYSGVATGAAILQFGTSFHELTHSYFARGIMPANGPSGWIDEAVTTWNEVYFKRPGASYWSLFLQPHESKRHEPCFC